MKFQDNIKAVAALQPDYLGFIFYERSPRFFDGTIPEIPKNIKKTGVFVNASIDYIIEKIQQYDLQAVQLHGNEASEFCAKLKAQFCHAELGSASHKNSNDEIIQHKLECHLERSRKVSEHKSKKVEIIKVFTIKDTFNFEVLKPYEAVCNYYLFDTKGKNPGGNGYTFNWEALKNYPSTKPYFLSGGIGLEEVDNVISFLQKEESGYCYAIDVNSKFEIEPGLKDEGKLKEFIKYLSFLRRQESN